MDPLKLPFDSGQELCFDKSDFEKANFSVDAFLDRRGGTNFETLRDDLGRYLKELRSAMIELINQDYSDFVNLSSNLIGLDRSIAKLKVPLGQFKEEILQVKGSLDEAIDELTVQLQARDQLRQSKSSLTQLRTLLTLLAKMEAALGEQEEKGGDVNLERVSAQLSESLVCLGGCRNLSNEVIKKHEELEHAILTRLDSRFLSQLNAGEVPRDCLRVYAGLGCFEHAENLVRRGVVAPKLTELVRETTLKTSSTSVMFASLMAIFSEEHAPVKILVSLAAEEPLTKFQFILNSYWPEVCDRLINNTPSVFAPGNPDEFYIKYTDTMKFLDAIEISLGTLERVEEFRARQDYKNFMNKWNLPVYYQIRFQEIAGDFERVLEFSKMQERTPADSEFQLLIFQVTWEALQRCWLPGVFLAQLTHRFWKLTLQILSRLRAWVERTMVGLKYEQEGMLLLAQISADMSVLMNKLPLVLEMAFTSVRLSQASQELLKGNLEESRTQFLTQQEAIAAKMVDLGNSRGEITKCVTDIPRIYRRTNREVPTRAGAYVAKFLQPAKDLGHAPKFAQALGRYQRQQLVAKMVAAVTDTYLRAVQDLLTSVQKTEDSLRRLKQIRDKSSSSTQPSSSGTQSVSDDDKIRLQVLQDCREFRAQVEALGVNVEEIPALSELKDLVEKSVSIPKN